jgi:hypothetical protein
MDDDGENSRELLYAWLKQIQSQLEFPDHGFKSEAFKIVPGKKRKQAARTAA